MFAGLRKATPTIFRVCGYTALIAGVLLFSSNHEALTVLCLISGWASISFSRYLELIRYGS